MIPDRPIEGHYDAGAVQALMDQKRFSEVLIALEDSELSEQTIGWRLLSLRRLDRWPELVDLASTAMKMEPRPSPRLLARAHGLMGFARMRLGTPLAAEKHFRAAIHIATWDLNDEAEAMHWHREMAVMYKNLGRWQQAKFENLSALATADAITPTRSTRW